MRIPRAFMSLRIPEAGLAAYDGDVQVIDASSICVHQHAANGQEKSKDPVACVESGLPVARCSGGIWAGKDRRQSLSSPHTNGSSGE